MKKRILFVDDEPFVLNGLQRMLRPLRDEWELTFAESGQRALELMAHLPFDVVVSDMRMPGMNGAELLQEVMRRHPHTIRLVLSAHSDHELMMKCVGSAHQCLFKPCDPADLQATLRRAAGLGLFLANDAIRHLVTGLEHLPSVPSLYWELVALLQRPQTSVEDVARVVERDPAMTAQMLKLVNSAFFGLGRRVSSAFEACTHLGVETVRSLGLSLQTFSQFQSLQLGGIDIDSLWRHSLRTAQAARRIAQLEDAPQKIVDESFVAGLLHDVGKLILAGNRAAEYRQALQRAREKPGPLVEAEKEAFGCDHAEIGGYLLGLWGLPVPVVEAIALHHSPASGETKAFDPVTAVHAANVLVQERDGPSESIPGQVLDLPCLHSLGLDQRPDVWRRELEQGS